MENNLQVTGKDGVVRYVRQQATIEAESVKFKNLGKDVELSENDLLLLIGAMRACRACPVPNQERSSVSSLQIPE